MKYLQCFLGFHQKFHEFIGQNWLEFPDLQLEIRNLLPFGIKKILMTFENILKFRCKALRSILHDIRNFLHILTQKTWKSSTFPTNFPAGNGIYQKFILEVMLVFIREKKGKRSGTIFSLCIVLFLNGIFDKKWLRKSAFFQKLLSVLLHWQLHFISTRTWKESLDLADLWARIESPSETVGKYNRWPKNFWKQFHYEKMGKVELVTIIWQTETVFSTTPHSAEVNFVRRKHN